MHTFTLTAASGFTIFALVTKNTGLTLFGTCSYGVHQGLGLGGFLVFFVYVTIAVVTIWYFKSSSSSEQSDEQKNFKSYLYRMLKFTLLIFSGLAISNFVVSFNCSYWHEQWMYLVFGTAGNMFKVFTPFFSHSNQTL